jgi:tetratricopeptide (TPR) repeat protein
MKFWAQLKEILRIIWLSFALNALLYFAKCAYADSRYSIAFIASAALICFEIGWVLLLTPSWLAYICKLNERESIAAQILKNSPALCLQFANNLAPGSRSKLWRSARVVNILVVVTFIAATSIYLQKVSQLSKKINTDYEAGRYEAAHSNVDALSRLKRSVLGPLAAALPYQAHAYQTFYPVKKRISAEAEWALERSIPPLREAPVEFAPRLAKDLSSLAELKMGQGEVANAKALYEEAIKIEGDAKQKNHDLWDAYLGLARCELYERDYANASKNYEKALDACKEIFGDNSEYTIRCSLEFAEVEAKCKNLPKAESLANAASKSALKEFDNDVKRHGAMLNETYRQVCAALSIQEQILRDENEDLKADLVHKQSVAVDRKRQDINKIDRSTMIKMIDKLQDLSLWLVSIKYSSKDAEQARKKLEPYMNIGIKSTLNEMLWGRSNALKPEKPLDFTNPDFNEITVETVNSTEEITVSIKGTVLIKEQPNFFCFRYAVAIDPKNADGFDVLRIQQLVNEDTKNL